MPYGYQFKCDNCKISGLFVFFGAGLTRNKNQIYFSCPKCNKVYGNLVGDYGFFADNEYRILYRNKKNTKWIIHLKCGADKVDLIKKCICPECQSDLIDINKRFKELKKKKGVSSCFFCKNEEMGVEYKTWFN